MLKLLNLTELMQVLKEEKHKRQPRNTLGNNNKKTNRNSEHFKLEVKK